ncbi:uncharacterized protein LOC131532344 isoform X2 [Onychostoma macrolepis]|nr:uncharacterized protein LOC131532344 isoform X2 [Onychostoma macrolepis]
MASDVMCLCVFLLCSGLQFTTGCEVFGSTVSCSSGESALLPCRGINSQHTGVQWWICDPQMLTLKYSVCPADAVKGQRYKDRVQTHGNLSLSITRLTVDDAGTYCCKTTDPDKMSHVYLTVEGCSVSGNEGSVEISGYSGDSVLLSCSVKCSGRHEPGNLSLLISDLTEKDEGLYSCWSKENQHKNFTLTVTGCVLSEHHITKSSYAGGSVTLPCSCEDPKSKPEHFEWKRAAVNETLVSDAEEINGRFQMIRDSPHKLFLRISNLTETDGGVYVCSVNGKQSRRVNLTLTDSAVINALEYQYYQIFLASLLCLMLLLVAGCICWRFTRARKQRRGSQLIQSPDDEDDTYTSVVYSSF